MEKSALTEKQNMAVYKETTKPKKPKRRDKSDLGPDFVAPDGGWGWVVVFAAGFSNLAIFPAMQQYGFIYRDRLTNLGFTAKQTTSIINVVIAFMSLIGIVNGAMFRRFTFRQVAMAGSLLVVLGIFSSAFCTTFVQYIICFSAIFGIGIGLCMAATSLAVNTYFKNKRRRATGFAWTITGLGPIIFPHVSTFLLVYYGAQGTIMLYAGWGLNAFLCALTLQPVLWHVQKPEKVQDDRSQLATIEEEKKLMETNGNVIKDPSNPTTINMNDHSLDDYECKYCLSRKQRKRSIFSSQYLFMDDDPDKPGYEITEPGTPMLARANDGWFGSKISLTSEKGPRYRLKILRQVSMRDGTCGDNLNRPNYFHRERLESEHYTSKQSVYSKSGNQDESNFKCTCAEEKALLQSVTEKEIRMKEAELKEAEEAEELAKTKMTFGQKVVKFFDLDLMKDLTFVNLACGMTVMMFCEMNFSVLTPFILNTYGYTNEQISLAMSILGGMDISVRFLAPLCLEKVKLDNQVLFAFGIIVLSVGRLIVALTSNYHVVLGTFLLIGFGKGFRTIFSPLIIPSYVPLNRLPAASGIQLMLSGMFSLAFGPILGIITDATSYVMTIHAINVLTAVALLFWLAEAVIRRLLNIKPVPLSERH